jgi:hypothetical protein
MSIVSGSCIGIIFSGSATGIFTSGGFPGSGFIGLAGVLLPVLVDSGMSDVFTLHGFQLFP